MKVINKYLILTLLTFMFLSLSSAEIVPQKQLTNYTLVFSADNATGCNFAYIQYADNSISNFVNAPITQNGQMFTYNVAGGNFSKLGNTCMFYTCTNPLATPNTASGNTCVFVTQNGSVISLVQVSIYIVFLLVILSLLYLSVRLIYNNPYAKDEIKPSEQYNNHKNNRFLFYLNLLKKKFWMIGVFGIYLSLFLFTAVLNNLVYALGLTDLNLILIYVNDVLAWGSIPFVLFWFGYIIVYFFTETTKILKYQFGGFR